jgi:hypothetical protein
MEEIATGGSGDAERWLAWANGEKMHWLHFVSEESYIYTHVSGCYYAVVHPYIIVLEQERAPFQPGPLTVLQSSLYSSGVSPDQGPEFQKLLYLTSINSTFYDFLFILLQLYFCSKCL